MSFGLLDVEADSIEQGFEAKTYDPIIASNVIRPIKNLDITLANTRELLQLREKFILFEMSISLHDANWVHIRGHARVVARASCSEIGPLIYLGSWSLALHKTNFSCADICP